MTCFAAVVLAGGPARRMNGALKPAIPVGGQAMLLRVLAALGRAGPRIVVGPLELVGLLPPRVSLTMEQPPGGGPVAALAAGLRLLPSAVFHDSGTIGLFGGDLPFLDPDTVQRLHLALADGAAGAVLVDDHDRPQWLCGVWRTSALAARVRELVTPAELVEPAELAEPAELVEPADLAGRSMRELAESLTMIHVRSEPGGPPPWFDCDTTDDLRQAEEMADGGEWGGLASHDSTG